MITLSVLFLATLFLAYSNGANDNFKGVATLFGSATTSYVSVGSLFGIGLITREANRGVVSGILMSWLLTLPIAAIISGVFYAIVVRI
jgi:phosphate/sulfate permease